MTYSDQVCAEVAERYGVPVLCAVQIIPRGVSAFPESLGMPWLRQPEEVRTHRKRLYGIYDQDTDRIITMRKQGASYRQIAKEVERSVHGVYRIAYLWG